MKKNDVISVKVKSIANQTLVEDAEKIVPVGRGYLHKALDESFIKHKVGDSYEIELSVAQAYGSRNRELIKMVPTRYFRQNNVNPVNGLVVNIDGLMGKIISASPGRVMVDFNHPLSGKNVTYKVKINKLITDKVVKAREVVKAFLGQELSVKKTGESIVINDTVGLPKSIKERIERELIDVLGKAGTKIMFKKGRI